MLSSDEVSRKAFRSTVMRQGYDQREVDDFLDEVVAALRYYEQGGRPASPSGSSGGHAPGDEADDGSLSARAARWLRDEPDGR